MKYSLKYDTIHMCLEIHLNYFNDIRINILSLNGTFVFVGIFQNITYWMMNKIWNLYGTILFWRILKVLVQNF